MVRAAAHRVAGISYSLRPAVAAGGKALPVHRVLAGFIVSQNFSGYKIQITAAGAAQAYPIFYRERLFRVAAACAAATRPGDVLYIFSFSNVCFDSRLASETADKGKNEPLRDSSLKLQAPLPRQFLQSVLCFH